jgi:hypothetical protein
MQASISSKAAETVAGRITDLYLNNTTRDLNNNRTGFLTPDTLFRPPTGLFVKGRAAPEGILSATI